MPGIRRPRRDRWSDAVCTALQLTNFWQDLEIDWEKGRVYVPQSLLRASGAREDDLARRTISPEWQSALRAAAAKTRELFQAGRPVADSVTGRLRWELRATWLGGMRILDALDRNAFDVFHARPALDWRDAGAIAWQTMNWPSVMTRKTSFYYSFLVLPKPQREAITAVFDVCRAIDDSVDLEPDTGRAGTALESWRAEVARVFDGEAPQTRKGRSCSRSSSRSTCRASSSRRSSMAWRWM